MAKKKISDERMLEQIEKGLNNKQILDHFEMSAAGTSYKRLDRLRQSRPKEVFDLQRCDTVTRDGAWYRVTAVDEEGFTVKSVSAQGDPKGKQEILVVSKADYMAGTTGLAKRRLPPVTTYIDESLKGRKKEPVYSEIVNILHDNPTGREEVASAKRAAADSVEERIQRRAKEDIEIYRDIKGRLTEWIEAGQEIILHDVTAYNEIVARYGGGCQEQEGGWEVKKWID